MNPLLLCLPEFAHVIEAILPPDYRNKLLTIYNDPLMSDAISHLTIFPIASIGISGRQN